MNWLFDHFQFVIIVALAFASWVKHRADSRNAEQEERRAREEMAGDETGFEPEDDWQVPPLEPAPEPLVRRAVPPPLMSEATPPPLHAEMSGIEAILQHQRDIEERLQRIQHTKATTTGNAAETRARIAAAGKPQKSLMPATTGLRGTLRNPGQTRRAIVLREILGPPVGLR